MLACVILVTAASACQAYAFFDSMTSMFTAVSVPQASHYQTTGLTNSNFLKNSLNLVPDKQTTSSQNSDASAQDFLNLNLKTSQSPAYSSFMNNMLTPGVNESDNPAMSSYDQFLKKYTKGTGNIFNF